MGTRDTSPFAYNGQDISFQGFFSPESQEPTRSKTYRLFGTVDHHGHHMGGHYTAQSLNPVWKCWHRYDDETASPIEKPVFGIQTYMMLFR
jgi:ubiquitin C-terminal hydrolase